MINSLYEPFRHWSDGGSIYLFSDTHFDDIDCKLMSEDWIESDEQVKKINDVVNKNDTLILLGDVGDVKYLDKIKTKRRVLITGNHDYGKTKYEDYFSFGVFNGALFISDKILLSHEPIFGLESFCLNIHGHDHSGFQHINHINMVANGFCKYTPINLKDIITSGTLKKIPNYHRITVDKATVKVKGGTDYEK